jgi:hypothetical protein
MPVFRGAAVMTAEGWRNVVERAQHDEKVRDLLVRLLTEQDAAKNLLQKRFACTGRPWPDLVADVFEAVESLDEIHERLDDLEQSMDEALEVVQEVAEEVVQGEVDDDEEDDMPERFNYPANWPRCACGRPVLDGHLTCGRVECDEGAARQAQAEQHFPNVECPKHPGWRAPGFCVCVHVLDEGAPIAHYHDATPRQLGEVLCEHCITDVDAVRPEGLRLICAQCVEQLLATRAPKIGDA